MRRQTYGYLPSRRTSLPYDWYQIILLDDNRWTCVNNLPKVAVNRLELNLRPVQSQADNLTIAMLLPKSRVFTQSLVNPFYGLINCSYDNNKKCQSNLGRAASPPLPKPLLPPGEFGPSSNIPIPRPTPVTTPNGTQIQSAILPQTPQYTLQTDRPTDRQTDRQTDGIGNKSVSIDCIATRLISVTTTTCST